jgi:hypothetical protein
VAFSVAVAGMAKVRKYDVLIAVAAYVPLFEVVYYVISILTRIYVRSLMVLGDGVTVKE